MKRPFLIAGVTATAGLVIWRLREQGKLETTMLENGVEGDVAAAATANLLPFFSFTSYGDVVTSYAPTTPEDWQDYANASAGLELVAIDG